MFHTMPKPIASKMTENPCHQWGIGKNKVTSDAKAFIQKIFDDGLKKRPAVASEVEILMLRQTSRKQFFERKSLTANNDGFFRRKLSKSNNYVNTY